MTQELTGAWILTNSRIVARQTCQQLEHLRYQQGIRPVRSAHALGFGSLVHDGLEAWSKAPRGDEQLTAALAALDAAVSNGQRGNQSLDPYDVARARVMLTGYHERWVDDDLEWVAVEQPWSMSLRNPASGKASRLWKLAGKFDAIARDEKGHIYVVERKTSSSDIGFGSSYWARLTVDNQVSMYLDAARANGFDARGVLYDVLGKPKLQPATATPLEKQKRKADGSLYANQRERNETPQEYEARLVDHLAEQPARYYARGPVVRLENEVQKIRKELWDIAQQLRDSQRADRFPRNPNACERYGRLCEMFAICAGQGSADDTLSYRRVTNVHPELV